MIPVLCLIPLESYSASGFTGSCEKLHIMVEPQGGGGGGGLESVVVVY